MDLRETHISSVLLAGDFVYKIKKPVNLGFLDFSGLDARRRYCEEELRLNRRTAPELYLEVVPITGSIADPRLDGEGPAIEYAVRMRRFSQDALLDAMAREGRLSTQCLDVLALRLAGFHRGLAVADAQLSFGTPARILADALQNFEQIQALSGGTKNNPLSDLRAWTLREYAALEGAFAARKREGFVRECHGDLHLGNIVLLEGMPTPFDGIEFNPAFRWIDVMNEVAFLVMDLTEHRLADLGVHFLNRYLEATGDYAGLRVLRFYLVYRALVRAKVACIRAHQPGAGAGPATRAAEEFAQYLNDARATAQGARRALLIVHGLSGSGKTTIARQLATGLRGVQLRSDVERKRLHGLDPLARTDSGQAQGIYAPEDTERTYARLADLARQSLDAGYPVIVDASFLAARHRAQFRELAHALCVPFAIACCSAPDAALRARVVRRAAQAADASEAGLAVLEQQIAAREAPGNGFSSDESAAVLTINTSDDAGPDALHSASTELARRLGLAPV